MFSYSEKKTKSINQIEIPEKNSSGIISFFKKGIQKILKTDTPKSIKEDREDCIQEQNEDIKKPIEINYKGENLKLQFQSGNFIINYDGEIIKLFDSGGKELMEAGFDSIQRYLINRLDKGKLISHDGILYIDIKLTEDNHFIEFFNNEGKKFGSVPNLQEKDNIDKIIQEALERTSKNKLTIEEHADIITRYGVSIEKDYADEYIDRRRIAKGDYLPEPIEDSKCTDWLSVLNEVSEKTSFTDREIFELTEEILGKDAKFPNFNFKLDTGLNTDRISELLDKLESGELGFGGDTDLGGDYSGINSSNIGEEIDDILFNEIMNGFQIKTENKRQVLHVNSVIANTSQSISSNIQCCTQKEFDKKYESSSVFGKIRLSLFRKNILKRLAKNKHLQTNKEIVNSFLKTKNIAADRIFKSRNNLGDLTIDKLGDFQDSDINKLAESYINGEINESFFWTRFEQIINFSGKKELSRLEHKGTNILLLLNIEKEYRLLLRQVKEIIEFNSEINDGNVLELFKKFACNPEKLLFFIENSGIKLNNFTGENLNKDSDEFDEKVIKYLKDVCNEERELNFNFEILDSGKGAFQMLHNDRKNGIQYKIGNIIDVNPVVSILGMSLGLFLTGIISSNTNNPTFFDNETVSYILNSLKISSLSTLSFGSIGFGLLNYFKNYANFTNRQEEYEKNKAFSKEDSLVKNIKTLEISSQKSSGITKKLASFRKNRLKKELKKYDTNGDIFINSLNNNSSTHNSFEDIELVIKKLESFCHYSENIGINKNEDLEGALADSIARLELWKITGHNFYKCKITDDIEKKYKNLYDLIIISLKRLGCNYSDFVNTNHKYLDIYETIKSEYEKSTKVFEQIRVKESLKKGALSASVFATSNILGQYLSNSFFIKKIPGNTLKETCVTIDNDSIANLVKESGIDINNKNEVINFLTSHSYEISGDKIFKSATFLKPEFANKLHSILGDNYDKFINLVGNTDNNLTLREILTKNVFKNAQLGNEAKNKILEMFLDGTNNDLLNSLTGESIKNGLFDLLHNEAKINKLYKTLKYWGYNVKKDWIIEKISLIQSGNLDINSLSIIEKRKLGEILWSFVGKNTGESTTLKAISNPVTTTLKETIKSHVGNIVSTQHITQTTPEVIKTSNWLTYTGIPWLSKKRG